MSRQDAHKSARKGLSSWAILRPVGTLTLTSVVVVLGIFFLRGLPLDLLPSIVYPTIRVNVNNTGVDPEVLEETIAKPLEASLSTTEDLIRMETDLQQGRVAITLEFGFDADVDFALQEASKNMDRVRSALPEEADPPTIFKFDPSQSPIYEVAFSSGIRDLISLKDWVDNRLRPQLLTIEGVASVDIAGGLTREVEIILDQERLRSYGLSVAEVINALRLENQDVAAGRISGFNQELVGKTAGKFSSVEDIRSVLMIARGGQRVVLSDVAEILDGNAEQRLWARLDGVPAIKLTVRKQPDANTVRVADEVEEKLASLVATNFIPADIRVQLLNNQAEFVRASVNAVRNAALGGGLLAMLVVFLFLGSIRKTLVVGLAIPLAILATFVMMGVGGLTLNIISLGGLALGVGLLVDNSIVMLENIFRHTEQLKDEPLEAAHIGSGEVQSAVIASTATNLAAVVPFLLITGLASLIFRELILTISFAVLASLLVSLTVVPSTAALLAQIRFSSGIKRFLIFRAVDAALEFGRQRYRAMGPTMLKFRWGIVVGGMASLGLAWALTRDLGSEFLPQVDDGNIGSFITLAPGSSPEQTNALITEVEGLVNEMPDVESVFATAGGFIFGASTIERAGRGSIEVRLIPRSERTLSADAWVRQIQQKVTARGFPGARIFFRPPRIRGLRTNSNDSPLAVTILGDNLDTLRLLSQEITAALSDIPGLQDIEPSSEEASQELAIVLDRERAVALGLDVQNVGTTLRTAIDGTVATRYTEGNKEFDVRVRFPRDRFRTPTDVGGIALFPSRGEAGVPIFLRDVAHVFTRLGPAQVLRENQNRILRLEADVLTDEASIGEVSQAVEERLAAMQFPDGYSVILGGEAESIAENNRRLAVVIVLAIFLVFVAMAVQYESLINPFAILFAIPLSLVGVSGALWITQTPLSAPVLLGVILLAGIVVNNAILLVEYIEQFREEGHTMEEAVVEAGAVRLRPILMTSLTTAFGMLPLAMGIGEGSSLMQPLAIAVVGGLSVSTVLTLFVVPTVYVILHRGVDRMKAFLLRDRELEPRALESRPMVPAGSTLV